MKPNWFIAIPARFHVALDAPPGVRLFHRDELHITVAFLGGVDEAAAANAFAVAEPVRTEIHLGESRALGEPRHPSALTALADDSAGTVAKLIKARRNVIRSTAGLASENRPPLPHVTFARIQRRASKDQRGAALKWWSQQTLIGELRVERIALYTWADDRKERLFKIVAQTEFSAPGER